MREWIHRAMRAHERDRIAKDKERRIEQIAAICDSARRGGISVDRAIVEIIDTARGDGDRVIRVGEQGHTPEVQT